MLRLNRARTGLGIKLGDRKLNLVIDSLSKYEEDKQTREGLE